MPNPTFHKSRKVWPNVPLDEWLNYTTHVRIECRWLIGQPRPCMHTVIMMTADLYAAAPGAVTYLDFVQRLVCRRCGRKGWSAIEPVGR